MNKELTLRLMLSWTCFVQAKNIIVQWVSLWTGHLQLLISVYHIRQIACSQSLCSVPSECLQSSEMPGCLHQCESSWGQGSLDMSQNPYSEASSVNVRCCSDKEGADVIRHTNTKDGIFFWITAELHHIC